ncbi:MAG: response regulator [Prevotella sp.]|nr:response regulator [Prevotella sp.]
MKRVLLLLTIIFTLCNEYVQAQSGYFYNSDRVSSNLITCIIQDNAGQVWIASDRGLNKFDGYRFTAYLHDSNNPRSLLSNAVSLLFTDRQGNLWVGTGNGLMKYDKSSDDFEAYSEPHQPRISSMAQLPNGKILVGTAGFGLYLVDEKNKKLVQVNGYANPAQNHYFSRIFLDAEGNFWKSGSDNLITYKNLHTGKITELQVGQDKSEAFISYAGGTLIATHSQLFFVKNGKVGPCPFDLSEMQATHANYKSLAVDAWGNLYIGTLGSGLFIVPKGKNKAQRVPNPNPSFDLNTANVYSLFVDRTNNLWVGCQKKGVLMIPDHKAIFSNWDFASQGYPIGSSVSSLCFGENGTVWTVVQNNGVIGFNNEGRIIAHPSAPNHAFSIYRDSKKRYWLGSSQGLWSYNPQVGASQLLAPFNCDYVGQIVEGPDGNIYFSTFGKGFSVYNPATHLTQHYDMYQSNGTKGYLCNDWIHAMLMTQDGILWLGTSSGLSAFNIHTSSFKLLPDNYLTGTSITALARNIDGNMVLGTEKGLYLLDVKRRKTRRFPNSESLQEEAWRSIVMEKNGDFWCATSMGIWEYQRSKRKFVGYVHGNGLSSREYVSNTGMKGPDGRIYFVTGQGLTVFRPSDLDKAKWTLGEIHLTNFLLNGEPISGSTLSYGTQIVDGPVFDNTHFTLSYKDDSFVMEFSLLNYNNAENISYYYRVNGADKWQHTSEGINSIAFNHLEPGSYSIEVMASDYGMLSPVKVFTVVIKSPWYGSTLAWLAYLLLAGVFAYLMMSYYNRRKIHQFEEDKMKTLINATHDIRSPLTLIMGPLHSLMKRDVMDQDAKDEMNIIEHNANRILTLVNQILDLRKMDKKQMHLYCQETDLVEFIGGVTKMFEFSAHERNMEFSYEHPEGKLMAWIDRQQFDKVTGNLLSNAFKYTYDGGIIKLRLSQGHDDETQGSLKDYAQIEVFDSGVGIKEGNQEKIFDRFFQGLGKGSAHVEGTGIGLNLCKMVVSMHHGNISAANRTDGHGSVFTVRIPLGKDHFTAEELKPKEEPLMLDKKGKKPTSTYRILMVDDDPEIRLYVCRELGEYYRFDEASDGKEALRMLLTDHYDCVITDVMMPEMDGFTLLRMIKTNINISDIPVIMLTSKNDVQNRLEGLKKGADAYIAKPFSLEEIHVTINNLVTNVLRLKGKFTGAQQQKDKVIDIQVEGNDEQLMDRIMGSINKNLDNPDFNVDMLTKEVGISRAQLHRKLKDMTGIPTSEFIRNIRLEQAARLLKEQKLNIAQVAFEVGFANQAHFSTVFKKHFGMSPSEYVQRNGEK